MSQTLTLVWSLQFRGRKPGVASSQPPVVVKPLEILPAALTEAEDAAAWYAERDPRVAARFAEELEAVLTRIIHEDSARRLRSSCCKGRTSVLGHSNRRQSVSGPVRGRAAFSLRVGPFAQSPHE